jgi:amidohydrolase
VAPRPARASGTVESRSAHVEIRRRGTEEIRIEVHTGIAHTGVVGILKGGKPGPKLAIRADMDALPVTEEVDLPFASKAKGEYLGKPVGVMHACGHDAHMAMTLGVAEAMAKMKKDLPGEVMFIFQPAEEGAPAGEEGGATLMVKDGVFKDFKPDAIFGMHVVSALPVGTVAVRAGGAMASSDTFRIVVHGKQSHGATPWKGIDPIVTAAEIVTASQTIVSRELDINQEPAVVTFGIFDGGQRFNIVPDKAELQGTVRAFDEGMRQHALASLKNIAEHVAAAHGASVDTQIPLSADSSNPVNTNDPALTARAREPRNRTRQGSRARSAALDGVGGFPALRPIDRRAERVLLRRRDARRHRSGERADQSFAEVLPRRRRARDRQ